MGKEKPVPRILRLKPEHVELMEGKVSFTPARFNVGESDEERSIVTSTGPYIITWNFRKVKQNKLLEYTMKKYGDIVGTLSRLHLRSSFIVVCVGLGLTSSPSSSSSSSKQSPITSVTTRRRPSLWPCPTTSPWPARTSSRSSSSPHLRHHHQRRELASIVLLSRGRRAHALLASSLHLLSSSV
jgi:hypothetical protein